MQQADNAQRTTPEVISLFSELAKVEEQRTAIMRQIEAAVGITRPSEQRKPKKKTLSNDQFLAACGMAGGKR